MMSLPVSPAPPTMVTFMVPAKKLLRFCGVLVAWNSVCESGTIFKKIPILMHSLPQAILGSMPEHRGHLSGTPEHDKSTALSCNVFVALARGAAERSGV